MALAEASRIGRRGVARLGLGGLAAALAAPAMANPTPSTGLTVVGKEGWLFPLWDVMARPDQNQLKAVTKLMGDAIGMLKQARIEVVVALVPSKVRTYRQFLPAGTTVSADVDRRYGLVAAELRKAGALVPDLDAPFQAQRAALPLYFKQDTHWMPVGAELAAAETAKGMAALRLPASARPGAQLGPATTATNPVSDLLRFLPVAERSKYPAEQYQVRQPVATGGLVDDDVSDVVVLGNSFAQPRYGFAPQLSAALRRPVALVWKPNNYGAYHTLLEYLRSAGFRQQRPRVLVWQHLEFDMQNLSNSSSWGQNAIPPTDFLNGVQAALRG